MWNLEYELIATLLLSSLIGLLMGRFLCKSGEKEERAEKEKVLYALNVSREENESLKVMVAEQKEQLNLKKALLSKMEQENKNLEMHLGSSDMQRKQLLEELKVLEKYKKRFESLHKEFDLQTKQCALLKEEKEKHLSHIAQLNLTKSTLSKSLEKALKEKSLLETLCEDTKKALYKQTESNQQQNQAIKALSLSEVTLVEEKREYLKNIENLTEIKEQYEAYKETFNEDRINSLEEENSTLNVNLEQLNLEYEDVVSRLRAISSVVGAVGVEEE